MSISREAAIQAATRLAVKMGYGRYVCCSVQFQECQDARDDLPFLKGTAPSWIVQFENATLRRDGVVDDGDSRICVQVDTQSGVPKLLEVI